MPPRSSRLTIDFGAAYTGWDSWMERVLSFVQV